MDISCQFIYLNFFQLRKKEILSGLNCGLFLIFIESRFANEKSFFEVCVVLPRKYLVFAKIESEGSIYPKEFKSNRKKIYVFIERRCKRQASYFITSNFMLI